MTTSVAWAASSPTLILTSKLLSADTVAVSLESMVISEPAAKVLVTVTVKTHVSVVLFASVNVKVTLWLSAVVVSSKL